jgi:hypothetical protein
MFQLIPALILWVLTVALALPPAIRELSVGRFFVAAPLSVFGVIVPLTVYFLSALLVPEWQGACRHGWIDAFHLGKLALAPLVLWATAALYATDVLRLARPWRPWVRAGLLIGAVVSTACFLFGAVTVNDRELGRFLVVPLYVCLWYLARAASCLRDGGSRGDLGWALLASVPFWIGSALWSRSIYVSLPEDPSECVVVPRSAPGPLHPDRIGELANRAGSHRPTATVG